MSQACHRVAGAAAAAALRLALCLALPAGLAGCRHKAAIFVPPQIALAAPIELEPVPEPQITIEEPPEPVPEVRVTPAVVPPKPVARKKVVPPVPPAPPVQVASAAPAAEAIGALSSGGEESPQSGQEARDLIAAIEKRLGSLSKSLAEQRGKQVRQVRYFLKQAQQALNSGDAVGANNLATKAKLLMDDVEK